MLWFYKNIILFLKKKAHKYFGAKKHDVQELFSKECVKKCINIKNGSDKVNVGKVRDY